MWGSYVKLSLYTPHKHTGEERYNSAHSSPKYQTEVSGKLYDLTLYKSQHPPNRRLVGPQNQPRHFEEISFMPQPLCLWEKDPWYPLNMWLGGPWSWEKENNPLPLLGIKPQFLVHQAHSLVTTLTKLQSKTLPVSMLHTTKGDRAGETLRHLQVQTKYTH
jgi:hypothetical protein